MLDKPNTSGWHGQLRRPPRVIGKRCKNPSWLSRRARRCSALLIQCNRNGVCSLLRNQPPAAVDSGGTSMRRRETPIKSAFPQRRSGSFPFHPDIVPSATHFPGSACLKAPTGATGDHRKSARRTNRPGTFRSVPPGRTLTVRQRRHPGTKKPGRADPAGLFHGRRIRRRPRRARPSCARVPAGTSCGCGCFPG